MQNQIIQGDNLEVMKDIPDNHIDLIYCDILYGTGRNFNDYQDLKPIRSEIEDHYYPRLKEMYRILKDTGSIYLQMDTIINHWVRIIMDEIFGYDNFRNEIVWKRNTNVGSSKSLVDNFSSDIDFIFYYSKSKNFIFNKQFKSYSKEYLNRFKYEDGYGKYRWQYMSTYSMEKIEELKIKNKVRFSKNNGKPEYKQYLHELKGVPISNFWDDIFHINPMAKEKKDYKTQKPEALLERIIKASSNEGDLVADFYCGSGTTPVVAKKLNRNYIACDTQQKATDITNQRLKEVKNNSKLF